MLPAILPRIDSDSPPNYTQSELIFLRHCIGGAVAVLFFDTSWNSALHSILPSYPGISFRLSLSRPLFCPLDSRLSLSLSLYASPLRRSVGWDSQAGGETWRRRGLPGVQMGMTTLHNHRESGDNGTIYVQLEWHLAWYAPNKCAKDALY